MMLALLAYFCEMSLLVTKVTYERILDDRKAGAGKVTDVR